MKEKEEWPYMKLHCDEENQKITKWMTQIY